MEEGVPDCVAISIALALPRNLENLCRELNSVPNAAPFSDLRKRDNHPHITLAMGNILITEIPLLVRDLFMYTRRGIDEGKYAPLKLSLDSVYRRVSDSGEEYQLGISRTTQIVALHEHVMGILRKYVQHSPAATREMFLVNDDEMYDRETPKNNEVWEPNTMHEADGFKDKKPDEYNPHVSLKCRNVDEEVVCALLPIFFTADRVIVAYLGNYCSARQIAYEVDLGKK